MLAFNLAAELVYTNLLDMIDLAGAPIRAADRTADDLFVIVGGHAAFNPEPLADFIDAAVLGDGEEVIGEITAVLHAWKNAAGRRRRSDALRAPRPGAGVYVRRSTWSPTASPSVPVSRSRSSPSIPVAPDVPATRRLAHRRRPGEWPYPKQPLAPLTEVVHDRLSVEMFRGCTRGCRFCQAGMITRPVRERPAEQVAGARRDGLRRPATTDVDAPLAVAADFSDIGGSYDGIMDARGARQGPDGMPSAASRSTCPTLRVDTFTVDLAGEVEAGVEVGAHVRAGGGTSRLAPVIDKLIADDDLYGAVEARTAAAGRG